MKETARKGFFWHWGRMMFRYRWIVLTIWLVVFIASGLLAMKTPSLLKDNGFTPRGSDSDLGLTLLQSEMGFPASQLTIVYESQTLNLTADEHKLTIMNSLMQLRQQPYITDIRFIDATRKHSFINVQAVSVMMNLSTDDAIDKYVSIRSYIAEPQGMKVFITGSTAIIYDMQEASKKDIIKAEMIGLPLALLVLLVVFGTLVAAVLPLIVGVMSVSATLGIVYFIAQGYSLSNFLPNMVTMLGLAVGIDYALFMVSRFREELRKQDVVEDALAMTCKTAGKSIYFSGLAVIIGLSAMLFIDLNIFQSLAMGGMLVVTISVVVANTLLLSLLGLFGNSINNFRIIPAVFRSKSPSRFWEIVAYGVMKRPFVLVVIMTVVLIAFMLPITNMKLGVPAAEVLPPTYESRYGSDLLNQTFDEREMEPIHIAIQTKASVWELNSTKAIFNYTEQVRLLPGIRDVRGLDTILGTSDYRQASALLSDSAVMHQLKESKAAQDHFILLHVIPEYNPKSDETQDIVHSIRALHASGLTVYVTGSTAYALDIIERINRKLPIVVGFVMAATYLILLLAFRSLLLPLKAVIMNILSLGASIGIVVSVFQYGHFAELLQVTSIGHVMATLPVLIFCVVFGISMDYEVFLISRIMEEYEEGGGNERSTAEGLKKTGSLITSAALILIVVVGSFIFTDIEIMKAIGLGLAMAVFIDATLIRIIMVPALMKLLGKANWYAPKWMKPIQPRYKESKSKV